MATVPEIDYGRKLIIFLDMLGFSARLRSIGTDRAKIASVYDDLKMVRETCGPNPSSGLNISVFSDSILMSADVSPTGLHDLLVNMNCLISNLIQRDILLRGAIAVGNIHHNGNMVFGTGYLEAYELESKMAGVPRVMLSKQAVQQVKGLLAAPVFDRLFLRDDDGIWFLNYFSEYAAYDPENPVVGTVVLEGPANRIARFLTARLSEVVDDPAVYRKTKWLVDFWNHQVSNGQFPKVQG